MTPTAPNATLHLLPPGTTEVRYAEDQPQYQPLPTLRTPDGRVLSQWIPDQTELALLNNGVPVSLVLHTFNQPMQPIQITVGGIDLRDESTT